MDGSLGNNISFKGLKKVAFGLFAVLRMANMTAYASDASTRESAKAGWPITLVRLDVAQVTSPAVLGHPTILGDAWQNAAELLSQVVPADPAIEAILFARDGDRIAFLPHLDQAYTAATTGPGLQWVKAGVISDITKPGDHQIDGRPNHRLLVLSREMADRIGGQLRQSRFAEAHGALDEAFDSAAPDGSSKLARADPAAALIKPTDGFVIIPPGEFMMGSPEDEDERSKDEVLHKVRLTHYIEAAIFLTTQEEFLKLMGYNPSRFRGPEYSDANDNDHWKGHNLRHPVEMVSSIEAMLYLDQLSKRHGLEFAYRVEKDWRRRIKYIGENGPIYETAGFEKDKAGFRLPTEAEQEAMRKAGTTTPYPFGFYDEAKLAASAWYADNSGRRTHAVGKMPSNPWGLYDVLGNVKEWGNDRFGERTTEKVTDPVGPDTGMHRVCSGGSCWSEGRYLRSAYRDREVLDYREPYIGFRAVRSRNPTALKRAHR